MTIKAQHLICDLRNKCTSCSTYLWSPKKKGRYFYCPNCKIDILCDRGLIQNFVTDDNGIIKKENLCMICRTEVEERMWPEDSESIL